MRSAQGRRPRFAASRASPDSAGSTRYPEHPAAIRIAVRSSCPETGLRDRPVRGGADVELALSIVWLIAVVWLLVRALRQRSALRSLLPAPPSGSASNLAVIVPARNEAANIARCLDA